MRPGSSVLGFYASAIINPHISSLAAFSLQQLGLLNATDIIGGYQAWKDAGLPVDITETLELEE